MEDRNKLYRIIKKDKNGNELHTMIDSASFNPADYPGYRISIDYNGEIRTMPVENYWKAMEKGIKPHIFSIDVQSTSQSQDYIPAFPAESAYVAPNAQIPIVEAGQMTGNQSEDEDTIRGFGPAFRQGSEQLYRGGQMAAGQVARSYAGSSRDYTKAKDLVEGISEGKSRKTLAYEEILRRMDDIDAEAEESRKRNRDYRRYHAKGWQKIKNLWQSNREQSQYRKKKDDLYGLANAASPEGAQFYRAFRLAEEALEKNGFDKEKAIAELSGGEARQTWGDRQVDTAVKAISEFRPTEGFSAWVGQLVPQMIGTGAAVATSINPYTRFLAKPLGAISMGGLTLSSAGSSMADAEMYRREGNDVSDSEILRSGLTAGAIEVGTEIIPFNRYFNSARKILGKRMGNKVAKDMVSDPAAINEMENLLARFRDVFPKSIVNKMNLKEYGKDVAAEALSELVAGGGGALVQTIYSNPEDYPKLSEILAQAWDGAKAGAFMGAFLGAGSTYASHRQTLERQKAQGFVAMGDTESGVVEIVGERNDDDGNVTYTVLRPDGKVDEISEDKMFETAKIPFEAYDAYRRNPSESNLVAASEQAERIEQKDKDSNRRIKVNENLGLPPETDIRMYEKDGMRSNLVVPVEVQTDNGTVKGYLLRKTDGVDGLMAKAEVILKGGKHEVFPADKVSESEAIDYDKYYSDIEASINEAEAEADRQAEQMRAEQDAVQKSQAEWQEAYESASPEQRASMDRERFKRTVESDPAYDDKVYASALNKKGEIDWPRLNAEQMYVASLRTNGQETANADMAREFKRLTNEVKKAYDVVAKAESSGKSMADISGLRQKAAKANETLADWERVMNERNIPYGETQTSQTETDPVSEGQTGTQANDVQTENVDYDALLEKDPASFIQEYSSEFGEEAAKEEITGVISSIDSQLEKNGKMLSKETSMGKRAELRRQNKALTERKSVLEGLLIPQQTTSDTQATGQDNAVTDNSTNGPTQPMLFDKYRTDSSKSDVYNVVSPNEMTDEEKNERGNRLINARSIDVAANQIVRTDKLSARKAAEKWWDENVQAPVFYDTEVGEVEINRNSVESSLAHGYSQAKLDAITSLVEGFDNAVYLGTMPDSIKRGVSNHYFAYPINYNGKRRYVFCRAIQDINKNRLYVHEVYVADNIKKGNTLQTAASKPHGGIALYRDILANVLETVSENKDTYKIQEIQETSENSSSVEDTGNAEKLEQMWDERIRDYISEHYPTQATVSASTKSQEGIAENEMMQQDEELKRMVEQSKAEIDAAIQEEDAKAEVVSNPEKTSEVDNTRTMDIKPIGKGAFGYIYDQFKGKAKEAIEFLKRMKSGEAVGALYHKEIGDIDLVWGNEGTGKGDGFGLSKLVKYHPEVLENLQEILDDMHIVNRTDNRIQLESDTHQAAVRLTWDNTQKKWLLTAFEKKRSSATDNTTDTADTPKGKRNDTATPQNTASDDKDSEKSAEGKIPDRSNPSPRDMEVEYKGKATTIGALVDEYAASSRNAENGAKMISNAAKRKMNAIRKFMIDGGIPEDVFSNMVDESIEAMTSGTPISTGNNVPESERILVRLHPDMYMARQAWLANKESTDAKKELNRANSRLSSVRKEASDAKHELETLRRDNPSDTEGAERIASRYAELDNMIPVLEDEQKKAVRRSDLADARKEELLSQAKSKGYLPENARGLQRLTTKYTSSEYYRNEERNNSRRKNPVTYEFAELSGDDVASLPERVLAEAKVMYGESPESQSRKFEGKTLEVRNTPGGYGEYRYDGGAWSPLVESNPDVRTSGYAEKGVEITNMEEYIMADKERNNIMDESGGMGRGMLPALEISNKQKAFRKAHPELFPKRQAVAAKKTMQENDALAMKAAMEDFNDKHRKANPSNIEKVKSDIDSLVSKAAGLEKDIDEIKVRIAELREKGSMRTEKESDEMVRLKNGLWNNEKELRKQYDALEKKAGRLYDMVDRETYEKIRSEHGYRFQMIGSKGTRRATIQETKTLTDAVMKIFPESERSKVHILPSDAFLAELSKFSEYGEITNDENTVSGFCTPDGQIYINADEARIDTPLHEIGIHKMLAAARANGMKGLSSAIIHYGATAPVTIREQVKAKYPGIKEGTMEFYEEVAATAFGLENEGRIERILEDSGSRKWFSQLKAWFRRMWNSLRGKTEYDGKSFYSALNSMSHDEIGRKLFDMVTSGRQIFNADKAYADNMASFARSEPLTQKNKKSAPETVLPEEISSFKGTVVSSTDGTKILKNLDSIAKEYDNLQTNRPWTFFGDVANALGARQHGSKSQYATFETMNGQTVTIRLADHNASTKNFDNAGRDNGISIVISRKGNNGITNDGNAHIVEFFYSDKALQNADGKPLSEIVRSIRQTLMSGEYIDTTGLARREEVNAENAARLSVNDNNGHNDDIMSVNELFNNQLSGLTEENADKLRFDLGVPSEILLSAGVEEKPMILHGNKIIKKMRKHGFSVNELRNLPLAVANPIAVFNNLGRYGNRSILTELRTEEGNILVSVDLGKGSDVNFNIISLVFGKKDNNVVNWINKGLAIYIDKKKALEFLSRHPAPIAGTAANQELYSATNIINNFENPNDMADEKARELSQQHVAVGKYYDGEDMVNGELTEGGLAKFQVSARQAGNISDALTDSGAPDNLTPAEWIQYLRDKGAMDTRKNGHGEKMYEWLSEKNDSTKLLTRKELIDYNRETYLDNTPHGKRVKEAFRQFGIKVKDAITYFFDSMESLERIQDKIKAKGGWVSDQNNPYVMQNLEQGRINSAMERFLAGPMKRLTEAYNSFDKYAERLRSLGYQNAKDAVDDYLFARHAPERNAHLKDKSGAGKDIFGNDLTDQRAAEIRSNMEAIFSQEDIDALISARDEVSQFDLKYALDTGLVSQEKYDEISSMYDEYIPLREWSDVERTMSEQRHNASPFHTSPSLAGELEVERSASGRGSRAQSPLVTLVGIAQNTIVRGQQNMTLNALAKLYTNNKVYANDFLYVSDVDPQKDNYAPAWVKEMASEKYQDEGKKHVISARINGKTTNIYAFGAEGKRFIEAYKGLYKTPSSKLLRAIKTATRFRSNVLTTYNPLFWVSNTQRDVRFGMRNLYVLRNSKYVVQTTKNLGEAFIQIFNAKMEGEASQMYEEFVNAGGRIDFYKHKTTNDIVDDINKQLKALKKKGRIDSGSALKILFRHINNLSSVTEELMRYASYMTARQNGESTQEAAYLAHEVTANLARRGTQQVFSASYSFFNATMQGMYQLGKMFKVDKKKALVVLGADMAQKAVSMLALLAYGASKMGGDDDDQAQTEEVAAQTAGNVKDERTFVEKMFSRDNPYWKTPDYFRKNAVMIPLGVDDRGVMQGLLFQNPHNFRAITNLMDRMMAVSCGVMTEGEALGAYLKDIIDEFAPFNVSSLADDDKANDVLVFVPSAFQPLAEEYFNTKSTGGVVKRDNTYKSQPEYRIAKGNANKFYVEASKYLNELGGGGEAVRGNWLQVNPDGFQYFMDSYLGFPSKAFNSVINSFAMNDAEKYRYGNPVGGLLSGLYYQNKDKAMYQDVKRLKENVDPYLKKLLDNALPSEIEKIIQDDYSMDRITDEKMIIANEDYMRYAKSIKKLEDAWNKLKDSDIDENIKNLMMLNAINGIYNINHGIGDAFEEEFWRLYNEEKNK